MTVRVPLLRVAVPLVNTTVIVEQVNTPPLKLSGIGQVKLPENEAEFPEPVKAMLPFSHTSTLAVSPLTVTRAVTIEGP